MCIRDRPDTWWTDCPRAASSSNCSTGTFKSAAISSMKAPVPPAHEPFMRMSATVVASDLSLIHIEMCIRDRPYFARLFSAPQDVDFSHAAAAFNVPYRKVGTPSEFSQVYGEMLGTPAVSYTHLDVYKRQT